MGAKRFLFTNNAIWFVIAITALFPTATALAEIRIVALGDSSFVGGGVPTNQTYPAQLEAALRARGHQVTVLNKGVNGDTAAGVLQRLDFTVPPGTDIVVLKIGEHELKFFHASPEVVDANRRTIVDRLRARGIEVYRLENMLQGLPPNLLVEGYCSPVVACHANAAGVAIVVGRTLPDIEALVTKVEKREALSAGPASR